MNAPQSPKVLPNNLTLRDINLLLVDAGFAPLDKAGLGTLRERVEREHFILMLIEAAQNPSARQAVSDALRRSGLLTPAAPVGETAAPAASTAPAASVAPAASTAPASPPSSARPNPTPLPAGGGAAPVGHGGGFPSSTVRAPARPLDDLDDIWPAPGPEPEESDEDIPDFDEPPVPLPSSRRAPAGATPPRTGGPVTVRSVRFDPREARPVDDWHVYGGKAALTFSRTTTRQGLATVAIDAALTKEGGGIDWDSKIRLQISARELPVFTAFFLGLLPSIDFGSHGDQNKSFAAEWQDKGGWRIVYAKVSAAGQALRALPIEPPDVAVIASLALEQYGLLFPGLAPSELRRVLEESLRGYAPARRAMRGESSAAARPATGRPVAGRTASGRPGPGGDG